MQERPPEPPTGGPPTEPSAEPEKADSGPQGAAVVPPFTAEFLPTSARLTTARINGEDEEIILLTLSAGGLAEITVGLRSADAAITTGRQLVKAGKEIKARTARGGIVPADATDLAKLKARKANGPQRGKR